MHLIHSIKLQNFLFKLLSSKLHQATPRNHHHPYLLRANYAFSSSNSPTSAKFPFFTTISFTPPSFLLFFSSMQQPLLLLNASVYIYIYKLKICTSPHPFYSTTRLVSLESNMSLTHPDVHMCTIFLWHMQQLHFSPFYFFTSTALDTPLNTSLDHQLLPSSIYKTLALSYPNQVRCTLWKAHLLSIYYQYLTTPVYTLLLSV